MKKIQLLTVALLAAQCTLGCSFHARSPEDYASETTALLKTKEAQLKSCYDEVLKADASASGVVAVYFTVTPKTGEIVNAAIDKEATTAPEALGQCVLDAMVGLKLDPPDQREGKASFSYDFAPNSPGNGALVGNMIP
jgi:hypothetical protein